MAKKGNAQLGGALTFLGSLVYLYVYFTWYSSGYAASGWLSMASFLAPLIVGFALFSAVTLFFIGLGSMAGKMPHDAKRTKDVLWKFVTIAAVAFVIITGGSGWYYWAVLALLLTYIGAMFAY
jgi:hypothetical protein